MKLYLITESLADKSVIINDPTSRTSTITSPEGETTTESLDEDIQVVANAKVVTTETRLKVVSFDDATVEMINFPIANCIIFYNA